MFNKRGKGDKDRCTMLPGALKAEIQNQMEKVKKIHNQDLKDGFGEVELHDSIAKKYSTAAKDFRWQWLFPQKSRWHDKKTGRE
ncbi:hypothetical protein [uncultured Treponema sp.]|uniref:hypothetical protein n=1 Tax=uncultured Treponema sp. TaxID=162155 RepID=UPI00258530C1|nr:hypothetical protein [uncultured Treponema sp.]